MSQNPIANVQDEDMFESVGEIGNDNRKEGHVTGNEGQQVDENETQVTQPTKKRRGTSEIWNHFTRLPLTETKGKHRAKCKYCGTDYASHPSNDGTKQLWRHFEKCPKNPNKASKGQCLFSSANQSLTHHLFSQDRGRKALARFLIKDEMPFRVVDGEGFRELLQEFQPKFQIPSRWTVARDCYKMYLEEADHLKKYFKRYKVRVSLTTDCWTSLQNTNYMCLTGHWIDDDWNMQKRILNFCEIEDHKGDTIAKKIEDCLFQWNIDKVFTITVDNASANDSALATLKKRLRSWDGLVCDGEFMQLRCAAHVLNLIVSEGLKEMNHSIGLIRHAVKYVKSSPSRKRKFIVLAERERVETQSFLTLDCPTRWNSTYLMLESAIKFIKVFIRMEEEDQEYKDYFKKKGRFDSSRNLNALLECDDAEFSDAMNTVLPPVAYDWNIAKEFLVFLKLFYTTTLKISGSNYVTSNTCFQHIVAIQSQLRPSSTNSPLLDDMARRMQSKYDKYWGGTDKMNPLLVVACILDPRFKLTYIKVAFEDVFRDTTMRETMLKRTMDALHRLYEHYSACMKHPGEASASQVTSTEQGQTSGGSGNNLLVPEIEQPDITLSSIDTTFQRFLATADAAQCNVEKISEVDEYLQADLVPFRDPKFDILSWWKGNAYKYKILSLVARDLLAAPVSIVFSESAFSTGGRVLDTFRSSLSSKMAEALICTQNWLSKRPYRINDLDVDNLDETANIVMEEEDNANKGSIASEDCVQHLP